ncbi:MAG TPA: glycosyltransferase family A protein, partial [Anaerolineaceae bacterium]|nr:glycosyltransferase family A protein [Anaerolineaceae bacterium]
MLDSLRRQGFADFEVILVDQNQDDRLDGLAQEYAACFPLQHLKIQSYGASRARNWGGRCASGDILLWPDDDSWLPEDFLERLSQTFESDPETACVVGVLVDESDRPHQRWIPGERQTATVYDA